MTISNAIFAGFLGLGAPELIIVLVIMLVLFGGAKLPSLAKGLGQSIKEFKKASKDDPESEKSPEPAAKESTPPAATTAGSPTSTTAKSTGTH